MEVFICLPEMCTSDLEHPTRCPALSELLTEFNMKTSSELLGLGFFPSNMVKFALCFEAEIQVT